VEVEAIFADPGQLGNVGRNGRSKRAAPAEGAILALTEEERIDAQTRFLREFEEEHERRSEALEHKRDRIRSKRDREIQREKDIELAEMREEMRARYHIERGYKQYIDSRGREHWLTPEEHEWRSKYRRRRRGRRRLVSKMKGYRIQTILLYAGTLVLAVILGMLLSR